jgi:hypothetical protein
MTNPGGVKDGFYNSVEPEVVIDQAVGQAHEAEWLQSQPWSGQTNVFARQLWRQAQQAVKRNGTELARDPELVENLLEPRFAAEQVRPRIDCEPEDVGLALAERVFEQFDRSRAFAEGLVGIRELD